MHGGPCLRILFGGMGNRRHHQQGQGQQQTLHGKISQKGGGLYSPSPWRRHGAGHADYRADFAQLLLDHDKGLLSFVDGLGDQTRSQTFRPVLGAVARPFDPAKRRIRRADGHRVDAHHPGLQFTRQTLLPRRILCPA
jgi:hypothetical protein